MTRKEEINKAKKRICTHTRQTGEIDNGEFLTEYSYDPLEGEGFVAGAEWADEHPKSPWISVKYDLPCNHKDFVFDTPFGAVTKEVLVLTERGYYIAYMHFNKEWSWSTDRKVSHWMQIPNLD